MQENLHFFQKLSLFTVIFSENEDDEEDIETELICLSKGGIEKIECYDHDKVPSYTR